MAIDRRVARTRTALYDALVALIRQKDYDLITVEDILREADVGRSTFYAHFTSKDDLLERSLERMRAELVAAGDLIKEETPRHGGTSWDPCRALFEHLAKYADVQLALAGGRGSVIVREAIDEVLVGLLREALPARTPRLMPRELAILHIVATFNTVLQWWLKHRRDMSAIEADALFRVLVLQGLPSEICWPFIKTANTHGAHG